MTRPDDPDELGARTLDPTVLESLRSALRDDVLVAEVIETFRAEAPGQIASLVAADARDDLPAVVATAHLIKGSALTLGAVRMVQLCAALEAAPAEFGDLVPAVAGEFEKLTRSLSDYVDEVSRGE